MIYTGRLKQMEYVDNDFYSQFSEDVEQDAAALEELARHQISEEDARDFRIADDAGFYEWTGEGYAKVQSLSR